MHWIKRNPQQIVFWKQKAVIQIKDNCSSRMLVIVFNCSASELFLFLEKCLLYEFWWEVEISISGTLFFLVFLAAREA